MGVLDFLTNPSTQQSRGLLNPMMPAPVVEPRGGISGWLEGMRGPGNTVERLNTFGMTLQDISDGGNRAATAATNRAATQEAARKAEALRKLQQFLSPQSAAAGAQVNPNAPLGAAGPSTSVPSLRDAAPALMAAQQAGIPIGDYISLLDKAGPNVEVSGGVAYDPRNTAPGTRIGTNLTNNNGFMVDAQNPANANQYFPDLEPGQRPRYDQNGQIIGVEAIPGAIDTVAAREGAISGARSAAQAPYQFLSSTDASGRPILTAASNVAGGTLAGVDPVAMDSRSRQASAADASLVELRDAVQAGRGQLDTITNLRQLLPDIIEGPGANLRLQAARLLAASGNESARRQVTATETFQNQARYVVKDLIRAFGANPTEGERKYAEQMGGADINLTGEAISQGFDLLEQRQRRLESRFSQAQQAGEQRAGGQTQQPRARAPITPAEAAARLRAMGEPGY